MGALDTVFEYIKAIFNFIKEFIAELFPQEDNAGEGEATDALK